MLQSKKLNFETFRNNLLQIGFRNLNLRIIAAVSGGRDSITLLHLLNYLKHDSNTYIYAVHVNHHLRNQADDDQRFVEKFCINSKIPLEIYEGRPENRKNGESIEMWARRIRYDALERIKKEQKCDYIFTGHHGNDQVETIIMHLDRSCGIEGLRGMKDQWESLIRPLLPFTSESIQIYMDQNNLNFVDDESNSDISIKRNFIRHKLIKPWQKMAPDIVERFRLISEKTETALDTEKSAFEILKKLIIKNDAGIMIIGENVYDQLNLQLFPRFIKYLCGQINYPWRRHNWEGLKNFLVNSATGESILLNQGWRLLNDRGKWLLGQTDNYRIHVTIEENQPYEIYGRKFLWHEVDHFSLKKSDPWVELIDKDRIQARSLTLRTWENGDEFQPLGMHGHKKVSDFLIDEKMDKFSKSRQLVLTDGKEIIWLCGQRLSESVKVNRKSSKFMELSFRSGIN